MIEVTEVVQNITVDEINYTIDIQLAGIQGPAGNDAPSDHGLLSGLLDDDHTQYHNDARGDVRYYTKTQSDLNYEPKNANIQSHIASTSNPHSVTKSQVGLGNVDNTSDVDKPISTATQSALDDRVPYVGASADINLGNSHKIANCQNPTNPQDLVTLSHFDQQTTGNSSDTQIIFNNGGQLWGDTAFLFDKVTTTLTVTNLTTTQINDSTLAPSILPDSRQLKLMGGDTSVDYGNTALMNYGVQIYNWTTGLFFNGSGYTADVMNRYLLDSTSVKSIDWGARQLFEPNGSYPSIDYGAYQLLNIGITNNGPLLDWSVGAGGGVKIYQGYGYYLVGDFSNGQLSSTSSGALTLDFTNRWLYDNTNSVSVDWDYHTLWHGGSISIDWQNKILYSNSIGGVTSINYGSHQLFNSGGFLSIDYTAHKLYDISGVGAVVSHDYELRTFYDPSSTLSIDYSNRILSSVTGSTVASWYTTDQFNVTGQVTIAPTAFTPTARLHIDSGNATAVYAKFTAGTTTGRTATDGFDIGITTAGVAEIRQRETQALLFFTNNTNYMSLASNSPTLTLDSQGSNSSNAGTIIFRTAGGSESFTQAFDASANVFTFTYGTSAALRIDATSKVLVKQGGTTSLLGAMATLNSQVTTVGNTTTTETTLHTVSTASSTWNGNGESVEVIAAGSFAANANGKQLKLKLGAVTLFDSGSLAINGGSWKITSRIFRVSTTTGKVITTLTTSNGSPTILTSYVSFSSFNFLTTNSLLVTGQATATNDIVGELFQAFWIPVA